MGVSAVGMIVMPSILSLSSLFLFIFDRNSALGAFFWCGNASPWEEREEEGSETGVAEDEEGAGVGGREFELSLSLFVRSIR